jgi:hypothetical protein
MQVALSQRICKHLCLYVDHPGPELLHTKLPRNLFATLRI